MTFQDVAHRLGTKGVREVREGTNDPVIAPGAILLRHADDQGLQLRVDLWSPWGLAMLGAVKLLRHEFAVPGQDRIGPDDGGRYLEGLLTKLVANLREGLPFGIRQPHASRELVAQHAILRDQILVAW